MSTNGNNGNKDSQPTGRDIVASSYTFENAPGRAGGPAFNDRRGSERDLVSMGDIAGGAVSFGVIGVGQAGGRIAEAFFRMGNKNVLAVNTAEQDLARVNIPEAKKLRIGDEVSGAGKDMGAGARAADLHRHAILRAVETTFAKGVEHLIIAFGAGGGTGGGASAPLVDLARAALRHLGVTNPRGRVGAIVALPTRGEQTSPRVAGNAAKAIQQMTQLAEAGRLTPLVFVDNERTSELSSTLSLAEFWPTVNNSIVQQFQLFNHLSGQASEYTSFDTADYRGVLEAGGCHVMGVARLDTTDTESITDAIRDNLSNALQLDGFRLSTAKTVGAIVVGGKKMFRETPGLFQRISSAFDVLSDLTGQATVHRGIYEDDQESLRVFTFIGGLESPVARFDEFREAA